MVDEEVNITEKRCPRRLMRNLVFRCRKMFGIEKKRKGGLTMRSTLREKGWADEDVNPPGKCGGTASSDYTFIVN